MKYTEFVLILLTLFKCFMAEKPCAVREIPGESVVCVCNVSYCDEFIRTPPTVGNFVIYTSSKRGLRFKESFGQWRTKSLKCKATLKLDPMTQYQKIKGFGGALTDAAAINWKSLPSELQDQLINSYFSEKGLEYNMIRTPIAGCDFSVRPYTYNELPWDDEKLSNFTFTPEDLLYKIPMFKAILEVAKTPVNVIATTWSPPIWMKNNENITGYSQLKPQYYQAYADYYLKFIELYNSVDIPIWGITTTNEPINGILALASFNSLGWTMSEMGNWIENNLGPTIRNSAFNNTIIMTGDDQRLTVPYWFNVMLKNYPKALEYIDGLAVHFYTDKFVSPLVFDFVTKTHPEKFILATEACEGSLPWERRSVVLGSWDRAVTYITDILEDLNYNLVGWVDWNMCLDTQGGPNWASNFVDSPIIVNKDHQEFIKQPMFYAMGHFAKFIPRDSVRIKVIESHSWFQSKLPNVAFITPRGTIVVVIYNNGNAETVCLEFENHHATVHLEEHSVSTLEFLYN